MILELDRGAAYKSLAEKVLGEGVEVRALTAEPTLKLKQLDEIIDAVLLVTVLRQQFEIQATYVPSVTEGPDGTQVVLVQLPVADANRFVKSREAEGGLVSMVTECLESPEAYCRCQELGHKS